VNMLAKAGAAKSIAKNDEQKKSIASRVPFMSILNSMSMEEIIESIVVLLLFVELGLRLLFLSIVIHP
jgi:hypothetical protein